MATRRCPTCDGKHKVECKHCGGEGKTHSVIASVFFGAGWEKCSICNGRKKVTCPECDGKGRIEC